MEKSKRSARKEVSSNKFDPEERSLSDIITEDGILCSILSHLRLREAVATCVLSPRWRQLWTNRHKLCFSIDTMFDSNTVCLRCAQDTPLTQKEILELAKGKTIQFIKAVNSVLPQIKGRGEVDEFQLEDVDILFKTESSDPTLDFYITQLFRNLPQLQSLVFRITGNLGVSKMLKSPRGSNRFSRLTRLNWFWRVSVKMSLLDLATLMDAFPILEEFSLTLGMTKCTLEDPPTDNLTELKKMVPEHPHRHLKTIEIIDFYYEIWQIEIVLYFLQNATELESITINENDRALDETQRKKLSQLAPANVNLVISNPSGECICHDPVSYY